MLQNNTQIKSQIDKLWNNFWSGGISNPLTAIEQITYLIFMKRLDDMEIKRERETSFTGEKYTSRFSGKYKQEVYEEIKYESPKAILNKLDLIEKEITTGLKEIHKMVS